MRIQKKNAKLKKKNETTPDDMTIKTVNNENKTCLLFSTILTPKDWKTSSLVLFLWEAVQIRLAGKIPDLTTPLAMLSAILPGPINPRLQ